MSLESKRKEIDTRNRVYKFYSDNKNNGKIFTVNHFLAENVPRSTIYDIIKRVEDEIGPDRKPGSGRKPKIMTKSGIDKLCKMFDHKCGISQRKAAKKMKCSYSLICKTLKTKTSIRKRKKIKIPARTETQKSNARKLSGRIYRNYLNHDWILDDESYFTLDNSDINGNDNFYSSNVSATPNDVKYNPNQKFPPKLLVCIAIGSQYMRQIYIAPSKLAITGVINKNECFRKKLVPFINKHFKNKPYVF